MDERKAFKDILIAALATASVGAVLLDDDDAHGQIAFDPTNPELAQRFALFVEGTTFSQFFEGEDPPPFNEASPPPIGPPVFIELSDPTPPEPGPIALPPRFRFL